MRVCRTALNTERVVKVVIDSGWVCSGIEATVCVVFAFDGSILR